MEEQERDFEERRLLKMFQADIERSPILTKEETYLMVKQAQVGDEESFKHLIESNVRFVLVIVFRYWRPGYPIMDMISEGCLGLIRSIHTFDTDKGFSITTYLEPVVRHCVIKAINDNRFKHISLDDLIYEDGDETPMDFLTSEDPQPDEVLFNKQAIGQIQCLLNLLNDRERKVIEFRFWHDLTLEQTGDILGLKKERVRQIEAKALNKLRWTIYNASDNNNWYETRRGHK